LIKAPAQRPQVEDEHPAYAPAGAWLPLPFFNNIGLISTTG